MIHRSFGRWLGVSAVLAVAIGWASPARACLTTTCAVKNPPAACTRDPVTRCWTAGAPLRWPEACVSFSVDQRGIPALGLGFADAEALVTSAFALWPSVQCSEGFPSIAVKSAGPVACNVIEFNQEGPNSNAVLFYASRWPHSSIALGVTTVSFDADTGRIVDADIEVNFENTALDFLGAQYVIAHEAGHFLGLDHSALGSALMFEQSSSSGFASAPVLTPDDIGAICAAYPTFRSVPATCDFEPEHGYSPVCGGDIKGSCSITTRTRSPSAIEPIALLAILAAFLTRPRRPRPKSTRRFSAAPPKEPR